MRLLGFEITRSRKPQTRFLGDLVKVELSPGDVCVLMIREPMTDERLQSVTAAWRAAVGDSVTLVVLDDGKRLGVLSPPQAAEVHRRIQDQQAVEDAVTA